ncbi:Histone-lysine N-methyltransferase, H3 lysine-9 specific protein [Melia azedarach]|uniref:Histone-lysine N-methyltransferase, H3 lysine-9 specific protein n=1 Tax=Melia azedarach TaxID=155640 RepID=A0ACC1XMK7_MELAZ|nr:Histone-lysine N-methyltransferase, H3 lysine-9 specific protein [Melia azedarach]
MGLMDNLLHTESARVVSLTGGSNYDDRSGIRSMENGHCGSQGDPTKYKWRRVSAVRDFPPGCGRLASRINLMPNEEAVVCTVLPEAETQVLSSNHVDRLDLVSADSKGSLFSDNESANASKCNISDVSKNFNGADIGVPKEETVLQSGLSACSPPDWPNAIPDGNNLDKTLTRNYPPRRRVSAIRDFPPFCGTNALRLSSHPSLESLDQEESGAKDIPLKETGETDVKQMGENGCDREIYESEFGDDARITGGKVVAEFEGHATSEMENHDEFGTSSKNVMKVDQEDMRGKSVVSLHETKQHRFDSTMGVVIKSSNIDVGVLEENPVRDIVVYGEEKQLDRNYSYLSERNHQFQEKDPEGLQPALNLVVVQGLMASSNCPWREGQSACKPSSASGTGESKRKKRNLQPLLKSASKAMKKAESSGGLFSKKNSSPTRNAHESMGALVIRHEEDSFGNDRECENFLVGQRSHIFDVTLPPRPSNSNGDATGTRNKVREILRLFQAVCRKLLQEEEAKPSGQNSHKRVDYQAARILKEKKKYVNVGKQIIGSVPGVEVGDEFQYRVELNIIGLHLQIQGGIDYVKHNGKIVATSIVASGGYDDDLDNSDILTYTGQGGNVMNGAKEPEDQKMERGNLALVNSKHEKNPVRVIRGETKSSDSSRTYVYDGLYLVERYWQDVGPHGKLVFKFMLIRIPGQPELAWKVVKKCKKHTVREGLCVDDISQGKELIPICAVNTIDDEKPPPFTYITNIINPDWCRIVPPKGCDCSNRCSESGKCSCVSKNGGEIPYNHNGAIVEAKPLVYECGPACKCPPSCYNRVSQRGIKFQLEIFKTETRGWGVRSLNSIPSGSFICEYVGELLEEKEAEKRTGNDEYLFDIGNNYNDTSLWDGLSTLMPDAPSGSCGVVQDGGFTIDAAQYGNVGRFINHSCSPNLYAQNVLYDHEDKRMPHIMLFAAENIPPLQELTYHYNYVIDQVHDSYGNIKKKICSCGSSECTGRLY